MIPNRRNNDQADILRFTYEMLQREQNQQRQFESELQIDKAEPYDLEKLFDKCRNDPKLVRDALAKKERLDVHKGLIRGLLDCQNRLAIGEGVQRLDFSMIECAHGTNICMSLVRFYRDIRSMRASPGSEMVYDDLIRLARTIAMRRVEDEQYRRSKWLYELVVKLSEELSSGSHEPTAVIPPTSQPRQKPRAHGTGESAE